jgi:hypothetical protein
MCRKIRFDREFWKLFAFWGELNKALVVAFNSSPEIYSLCRRMFEYMNRVLNIDES